MFKCSLILLLFSVQFADAKKAKSYFDNATQVTDTIWIGSTPSKDDISEFKANGINNVVFIGTEKELKKSKLNEAHLLEQHEIGYNWMQYGTRGSKNLETLNKFNDLILPNAGNKVVIHSRSYNRSRELVSAWLMNFMPTTVDAALKQVESKVVLINDDFMQNFASAE